MTLIIVLALFGAAIHAENCDGQQLHSMYVRPARESLVSELPLPSKPNEIVKNAKYKIAVIDTGFDFNTQYGVRLCEAGSYDYLADKPGIGYTSPHGTYIARIIAEGLKNVDYCIMVMTVFGRGDEEVLKSIGRAAVRANRYNAKAVNISLTGLRPSFVEERGIKAAVAGGVRVFIAAGNDQINLTESCNQYPACYDFASSNVFVIGALLPDYSAPARWSNFGTAVRYWESGYVRVGANVIQGTSFAAPKVLASWVRAQEQEINK